MREVLIPKHSGGHRRIVVPTNEEKIALRQHLDYLNAYPANDCAHGFRPERSPVTNAYPHVNFKVSICFDLKDFFDTVGEEHLRGRVSKEIIEQCLYQGRAAQGLPTSPALANIAAKKMDEALVNVLKKAYPNIAYTRYADDLTVSGNFTRKEIRDIMAKVKAVVCNNRFKLNEKKTKVLYSSSGRREICGVSVDKDVKPLSRHKKKLRALLHLGLKRKAKGMEEWCRLRIPKTRAQKEALDRAKAETATAFEEANKMLRAHHCRKMRPCEKSIKPIDDGLFSITNDPRYFACMSRAGNSWSSCMNITSNHKYRKGVTFWQQLKGVSLAVMWSDDYRTFEDVRIRLMAARCLLYKRRDGEKFYGRIYGGAAAQLSEWLEKKGYKPAGPPSHSGEKVEGHVPKSYAQPFWDNGNPGTGVVEKNGKRVTVRYVRVS